jgi:hypothetical protein
MGEPEGLGDGELLGICVGDGEENADWICVGDGEGNADGVCVGDEEGNADGNSVGNEDGKSVGEPEGASAGVCIGDGEGNADGNFDENSDGKDEGNIERYSEGKCEGRVFTLLGFALGAKLNEGLSDGTCFVSSAFSTFVILCNPCASISSLKVLKNSSRYTPRSSASLRQKHFVVFSFCNNRVKSKAGAKDCIE